MTDDILEALLVLAVLTAIAFVGLLLLAPIGFVAHFAWELLVEGWNWL